MFFTLQIHKKLRTLAKTYMCNFLNLMYVTQAVLVIVKEHEEVSNKFHKHIFLCQIYKIYFVMPEAR